MVSAEWSKALLEAPWAKGLQVWPWPIVDWQAVVRRRQLYPIDRKALYTALQKQNAPYLSSDPALSESLSLLLQEHTYTVTTGQQVGWLTGPLYTIYKAVSAIQLARAIEAQLGPPYRVVPIFWMASEDHDAEEVRWIATHWEKVWRYEGHFRGPVGRHRIEAAFPPQVETLALQRFYGVGRRWEEAFRAAMSALFQGTGLLLLSPDDPLLKGLATDLWVKELRNQLTQRGHAQAAAHLRTHHQKPRLHPRPINLFWLSDSERSYIDLSEKNQALRAAHTEPHRLSPNVLLRPLYQEVILPNLAYVAGPAELCYWLELRWVFEQFQVFHPVVWPRFSLRLLSEPPFPLYDAEIALLFTPNTAWQRLLVEKWEAATLAAWQEKIARLEPDWRLLSDLPEGEHALRYYWQKALHRLRKALYRRLLQKHASTLAHLTAWQRHVEPFPKTQERFLNLHALAHDLPTLQAWIRKLLAQPFIPGAWNHLKAPDAVFLQETN